MSKWILTKPGDGPVITEGAVLDVHVRTASNQTDFDDDGRVIFSTYVDGRPLRVVVEQASLLPEIYGALLGATAGSTIVVPVRIDEHGLTSSTSAEATLYVEAWIADMVMVPAEPDREILAVRKVARVETAAARLRKMLESAVSQRNGKVVMLASSSVEEFEEFVERHREGTQLPAPRKVLDANGKIGLMLTMELHSRLLDAVSTLAQGH